MRVYDPMEVELPDLGLVVMQDAETGDTVLSAHDRRFRKRFADAAKRREEALRAGLAEAGVDCLELTTDEPLDQALLVAAAANAVASWRQAQRLRSHTSESGRQVALSTANSKVPFASGRPIALSLALRICIGY